MRPIFVEKSTKEPGSATPIRCKPKPRVVDSPLQNRQKHARPFGTDITNRLRPPRPTFKRKTDEPQETPRRRLETIQAQGPQRPPPSTPIAFSAPKRVEPSSADTESPPASKRAARRASLSTLIKTRALELQTQPQLGDKEANLDIRELSPWNSASFISRNNVLLNPRRVPLEELTIYEYAEGIYVGMVP